MLAAPLVYSTNVASTVSLLESRLFVQTRFGSGKASGLAGTLVPTASSQRGQTHLSETLSSYPRKRTTTSSKLLSFTPAILGPLLRESPSESRTKCENPGLSLLQLLMVNKREKSPFSLTQLLMVTQTIPRSSDPYPPLPLPPHQPPLPRRPNPQPMQPRLSFGHQPHPEANPDQIEEHELNLHQNHQLHPHGPLHRPEAEAGGKAVPSFLEADGGPGPAREAPGEGPGHLAKYFEGPEGERRPPFLGSPSQMLELGHSAGAAEAPRRKRSFEETMGPGGPYPGQAEAIEAVREGGLHVAHPMVLGSDVTRALVESALPLEVPPLVVPLGQTPTGAAAPSEGLERGGFEALEPGVARIHGDGDVNMDEGFPVDIVALPAAEAPLPEISIEPMTPPSVKDAPGVRVSGDSLTTDVNGRSKEELDEEQQVGPSRLKQSTWEAGRLPSEVVDVEDGSRGSA